MRSRIAPATLLVLVLCAPGSLAAQTTTETTVTFLVPLNLTQLSPDLEKVRVQCNILASTVFNKGTLPATWPMPEDIAQVASGQVNTTMKVEYAVPSGWLQNAAGSQANYQCVLDGYSKSLQRWGFFSDNAPDAVFRLKPTPAAINGTFPW